mgnify:FL=1
MIAAALVLVALSWLLPTMLRRHDSTKSTLTPASNLAIIRDQLGELEKDLSSGILLAAQYQQARAELEGRALEETRDTSPAVEKNHTATRWTALTLALVIPLGAALLYLQLGTPSALSPQVRTSGEHEVTPQEVEAMVAQLAAKLETSQDDGSGWALLGRSYLVMQRYPDAVAAYGRAAALIKDDADLLADYADALAMSQGRHFDAKTMQIIERALQIDPFQWKALAMAGTAAFERKDYKKAVGYWEKVLQRAQPDSELARNVASSIEEARQLGGIKPGSKSAPVATAKPAATVKPAAVSSATIQGTVSLGRALAGKAAPTDTVFIFARAAQGPRMPLAIVRRQVKDLPFTFRLDDSQAMAPGMSLSNFPEVVVGARVSKSGGATTQSGDLQGTTQPIKVGARNVEIVIDSVVP